VKNFRLPRIVLLSCINLFLSLVSYGQGITLKGLVKTSGGKAIDNAILSVKYKNKQPQSTTTYSGKFSVEISDTLTLETVSFAYLGYETSVLTIKEILQYLKKHANEDYLVILKVKDINLNQITVTDTYKPPFYQNERAAVFDYEIMPNGNLLLVMEREIFLIDQKDSIIKTVQNTVGIDEIIKACSGRIFFRNKKFLYPIAVNDTDLLISKDPVEINSSLKQINELIACDTLIKIKELVSAHNQKIVYKLQPLSDPLTEINFYTAQNKKQIKWGDAEKAKIDRYDSLAKLGEIPTEMTAVTHISAIGGGSGGKAGSQYCSDEMTQIVWPEDHRVWKYEFFTSKKLYAPVFLRHDSIYVFDYIVDKITVMSYNQNGNTIRLNTILRDSAGYHKQKGWQKIIIQDSYTGDFFTVYRNERLVLNKIPLFENKKRVSITLPKGHLYVDRIKVYKHTVYYLWRDLAAPTSGWALYKMPAE